MRISVLGLLGILYLAPVLPATAAPSGPNGAIVSPVAKSVPIAQNCGKGRHWVAAGYAKHGKWRPGHCAPN